jgi:hypothetical protein
VKSAYARNATWIMNRTTLGSVRKLKDAENRYIWMPGIQNAAPNTIDGDPYVEMPDMPSEGAGLYPVAYGDFRRAYTWADRISHGDAARSLHPGHLAATSASSSASGRRPGRPRRGDPQAEVLDLSLRPS